LQYLYGTLICSGEHVFVIVAFFPDQPDRPEKDDHIDHDQDQGQEQEEIIDLTDSVMQ
jgi:hypothetical protein